MLLTQQYFNKQFCWLSFFFYHGATAPVGQGLFIEDSRSHSDTKVSRTPLEEWSARRRELLPDNTQHSQQTEIHDTGGNRTRSLNKRAALERSATGTGVMVIYFI